MTFYRKPEIDFCNELPHYIEKKYTQNFQGFYTIFSISKQFNYPILYLDDHKISK